MSGGRGRVMSWHALLLLWDCYLEIYPRIYLHSIFSIHNVGQIPISWLLYPHSLPFTWCYLQKSISGRVLVCKQLTMVYQCDLSFSPTWPSFNDITWFSKGTSLASVLAHNLAKIPCSYLICDSNLHYFFFYPSFEEVWISFQCSLSLWIMRYTCDLYPWIVADSLWSEYIFYKEKLQMYDKDSFIFL